MIESKNIPKILDFLDCDKDFLNELVLIYKKELLSGKKSIDTTTINQEVIKAIAHKLSGTASLLKLDEFHALLKTTEKLAEQKKCTRTEVDTIIKHINSFI